MFRTERGTTADFHCFNADTPENLVQNVKTFYELLRKLGYTKAQTPYDNEKNNSLIMQTSDKVKITEGKEHKFLAKVVL